MVCEMYRVRCVVDVTCGRCGGRGIWCVGDVVGGEFVVWKM